MRVLIVEDHEELALTVATGPRREGMAVDVAPDGHAALDRASVNHYDVVVLDRDLPGLHGDEVCRSLVGAGHPARVLMLTAAGTIDDRVTGLGIGADDYLPEPFAFTELVARIRALVRRAGPVLPPVLVRGGLRLDPATRIATRDGRRLLVDSLIALAVMAFAAMLLGWHMAGRVLRPLGEMTATVRRITADRLPVLPQPFQRLEAGRKAGGEGLGLGLSIVAAIVEAHRGTLEIRPLPAEGLDVSVTLGRPGA